MSVKKEPT